LPTEIAAKPPISSALLDKNSCHKQTRRGNAYMLVDGGPWYKITDLFTTDEIDRSMTLFLECKKTKEDFNSNCTKEVVEPVISRINARTGFNNSPASLVYRLEMYLMSVMGE
jgi:hypothetical protein